MFETPPDEIAASLHAADEALGPYAALRYCAEIGSTNDAALALALAGAPDGTSVLADRQTNGRGRRGHDWYSPAGSGIYLSVIVRPKVAADVLPVLTLAAGVAVAEAIRDITGLVVELKWPNDVVVGRPWRKLAGVLCEGASAGTAIEAVIVGIGLNVLAASYPPALASRASALESELGRPVDRGAMVVSILCRLRAMMDCLETDGREAISAAWRTFGRAGFTGASIRWRDPSGDRHGRPVDIDTDGALLVEVRGRLERVIAGDVAWER
jgi:BirA family biotin operon repressor/biotin-[acetyl-CoA-carboxylase] ligase